MQGSSRDRHAGEDEAEHSASLVISGSVLDDAGTPVPNIAIFAQIESSSPGRQAVSDRLGMFTFDEMPSGEYLLQVEENEMFHAAGLSVRAGVDSANIHLQRKGSVVVFGRVSSADGEILENARVRALGERVARQVDAGGEYEIEVERIKPGTTPVLEFSHKGFRTLRKQVPLASPRELDLVQLDAVLTPALEKVSVFGRINGPGGEPVADAGVALASSSPKAFHRTTSGPMGEYELGNVEIGEHYRLDVKPETSEYRRHVSELFAVGPQDTALDITLEAGGEAELSGILTDPRGRPLADFSMRLRNTESPGTSLLIRTDAGGHFRPVTVAAGPIQLESRSWPRLEASGITLSAAESRHIEVPLDWGRDWLLGQVVDPSGKPVPQARVTVQWSRQYPDVRSSSRRQTMSDAGGYFSFANIAGSSYQLTCRAPGYETVRTQAAPGSGEELLIELRPAPGGA
ncbi:MAG: carboxypeptidase-like regulatory domain-containing protein [Wenzhouxiangellaceae bacterium]|nr:carboxypeptidase-like regulatory domain-containing protein [Wenzhouxiangellaceae bacterium]